MPTKRTVTARLYALDTADIRHQLTATSAADLARQVQDITSSKQAATLARAAWGDDQADLKAGGVRIVAVGAIVREVWRSLPAIKGLNQEPEAATLAEPVHQPTQQPTQAPQQAQETPRQGVHLTPSHQGQQRPPAPNADTQQEQQPQQPTQPE